MSAIKPLRSFLNIYIEFKDMINTFNISSMNITDINGWLH